MSDAPVLIEIDEDWPQWRKDEAKAINDAKIRMHEAKSRPNQSSGNQGPSDLELRRQRREAEARRIAAEEASKAAEADKGSTSVKGKIRNRAQGIDDVLNEAETGRRKDNQSTDSSQ
jgi:hypothetical protein